MENEILDLLKQKRGGLSFPQLAGLLHVRGRSQTKLRAALKVLLKRGEVYKKRDSYLARQDRIVLPGEFMASSRGFGFVRLEGGGQDDVFIPARYTQGAFSGDIVEISVKEKGKKGKPEGQVIRLLKKGRETLLGVFRKRPGQPYLEPFDSSAGEVPLSSTGSFVIPDGAIVEADRDSLAVRDVLGMPDDPGVDTRVIIKRYGLESQFSAEASVEAKKALRRISSADLKRRVDHRDWPTVTIDGETAQDFDDAVSIKKLPSGCYRLGVHIADVSHYVRPGSAVDADARSRGTSVYFPDRAIPMFPPELSNEICCLHPGVDRLTLTVELKYDEKGERKSVRFYPSVIRSDERLTYTLVRRILVDGDVEVRKKFERLLPPLELMADLCQELRRRRTERGAIDFDLPEPEVMLNLQGVTEDIIRAERNLAHQIIEEFMIAANEAVARFMEEKGIPFIYRIHEPPKKEAIDEFRRFISHLGYRMRKDTDQSPKELQKVLFDVKGKPEERMVNQILLRSMKWARYSAKNLGHFGLASDAYTHFTSPIRRYPDLIVHRLLKWVMSKMEVQIAEEVLANKADHLSDRERVAMEAEREIVDRYRVRFMRERIGEEFEGIISGVTAFGFFVELKDIFVEGLVRVTSLPDDYYQYHEKQYCLVGERTHKTFRIGDQVKVRVDRVDVERRHIDFGLLDKIHKVKSAIP